MLCGGTRAGVAGHYAGRHRDYPATSGDLGRCVVVTLPPPGSTRPWSGPYVAAARAWLAAQVAWPTPCARCQRPVHPGHWHLGHRLDRQAHPQMTWVPSNWRVEHPHCSMSAGATQGNRRRAKKQRRNLIAGYKPSREW